MVQAEPALPLPGLPAWTGDKPGGQCPPHSQLSYTVSDLSSEGALPHVKYVAVTHAQPEAPVLCGLPMFLGACALGGPPSSLSGDSLPPSVRTWSRAGQGGPGTGVHVPAGETQALGGFLSPMERLQGHE